MPAHATITIALETAKPITDRLAVLPTLQIPASIIRDVRYNPDACFLELLLRASTMPDN